MQSPKPSKTTRKVRNKLLPTHHGLLLINKPSGITSHDVVDRVRRVLKFRQIGHLGTLDPMADGILPLALGMATRLTSLLINHDKVYLATFRLGVETDTHDRMGVVKAEHSLPEDLDDEKIRETLKRFTGEIEQVPPLISAKKYRGKPLYYWVRRGIPVPEPPPKKVHFYALELLSWEPPLIQLRIHCSAGAYVRALARDLGNALGCGAIVDAIRRVRWGEYSLDDAIDLDAFEKNGTLSSPYYIPLADIEPHWPVLQASDETIRRLLQGQSIPLPPLLRYISPPEAAVREKWLKILSPSGQLVAVAQMEYPHRIRPHINFPQLYNEPSSVTKPS